MSTYIKNTVVINAMEKDVLFDGVEFVDDARIQIIASGNVTFRNCRFHDIIPNSTNTHPIFSEVAVNIVVENCYFGKNLKVGDSKVYGLFSLASGSTGYIRDNYFAEGCDEDYLGLLYYPQYPISVVVGPNKCEFDVEEKHFGTNPYRIGNTGYATLAEAIEAVEEDGTILMRKDVPVANGVAIPAGKKFTLDMAGHKYYAEKPGVGSPGTTTQAFNIDANSTIVIKNGTIGCTEANRDYTWESGATIKGVAMIIQNYANLTLENMVMDGTNIAHNGGTMARYISSNNNGTVNYKNVTFITVPGDIAFDVCRYSSYTKVDVTAEGCIADKFEVSVDNGDVKDGCNLMLKSGKYGTLMMGSGADSATIKRYLGVEVTTPAGYGWLDQGDGTAKLTPVNM